MQERHNSIANALELRLPCTNPLSYYSFRPGDSFVPACLTRTAGIIWLLPVSLKYPWTISIKLAIILSCELGPSRVSPNQCSWWKHAFFITKTCLTFTFVMQQPFGIPSWNLGTCIFVAWSISNFYHIVVSILVLAALRCGSTCHGPRSDSVHSGSEHKEFDSPRLVKREAGFPNPQWVLIGSNQLWRINSLSPSDAMWRHRHGSTLAQVMACCLMAPSHYLNQCWLLISKVQSNSSVDNFTRGTSATSH